MKHLTRQAAYERVGRMEQLAGIKRYVLQDGRQRGVHAVDLWNGDGLYMNSEIQKKVSIIIPYYNSPLHLLNKCVQTAASQTYENCEVIVIVDGSTHNYRLVSALFENRQPKVRFVYKENGGVSSARNLGIKLSTGDFLVFIDSDDYIEEDYIEKMVAQSDNVDVVICGVAEQFFPTVEAKLIRKTFCSQPLRFCCLQYSNFSVNKLYRSDNSMKT